jgi:tetratricopeptide (TPR) repeat protein
MYIFRADQEGRRGLDPRASFRHALERFDRAEQIEPGFPHTLWSKTNMSRLTVERLVDVGQDPGAAAGRGIDELSALIKKNPSDCDAHANLALLYDAKARYTLASGADPRPLLVLGEQTLSECPDPDRTAFGALALQRTEALAALARGEDPEPAIGRARVSLQGRGQFGQSTDAVVWRAEVELTAVRWAMRKHEARREQFEAAFAVLRPLLAVDRVDPLPYQMMAATHERRAAWLLEGGKDPSEELAQGFAMAEKALSKNPRMGQAYATRGALYVLSARAAREAGARRDAAGRAKDALSAAFKENPLLEREHGAAREEAQRLLGEQPSRAP